MEFELRHQNTIKKHGVSIYFLKDKIVLGVPVPKNIPVKLARVAKSIELENIKGAIL